MNRRKAIGRILLLGGGAAVSYSGLKFYQVYKSPDLKKLDGYKVLLDDLAETIIPATDTPGAKAAGVGSFIITMVKDCTDKKTQNKFIAGLSHVDDYTTSKYNHPFSACSVTQKNAVMQYFQNEGTPYKGMMGKIQHKYLGDSFFATLKSYTVLGYCNSMQGASQALVYQPVPGKYLGCIPLQPGQKSWATQ